MGSKNENKHVVLFLAAGNEDECIKSQKLPLEILSLAGLLLKKGYHVIPIDANIRERYIGCPCYLLNFGYTTRQAGLFIN